jgi:hypothetical protein
MKIRLSKKQRQGGSAVIVVLVLLGIVMIYVGANLRSLANLERELRITEQRQTRRWQAGEKLQVPSSKFQVPNEAAKPE